MGNAPRVRGAGRPGNRVPASSGFKPSIHGNAAVEAVLITDPMPMPTPGESVAIIIFLLGLSLVGNFLATGTIIPDYPGVDVEVYVGDRDIRLPETPDAACERMGYQYGYTMGGPVNSERTWFVLHCGATYMNDTDTWRFPEDLDIVWRRS